MRWSAGMPTRPYARVKSGFGTWPISPVLIWMSGKDKLCTYFNQQWLEFTGQSLSSRSANAGPMGYIPMMSNAVSPCIQHRSIEGTIQQGIPPSPDRRRIPLDL